MNAGKSVLGVLGMCWVGLANPTQRKATGGAGCGCAVLGVLGLRARARACAKNLQRLGEGVGIKKTLREAGKTRQTRHTQHSTNQGFVFKGFFVCWVCVGLAVFVLGCGLGVAA